VIQYKITANNAEVIITLNAEDPNDYEEVQYEGDPVLLEIVQMWLPSAFGAFGHLIGKKTTPIDLDAALKKGPRRHLLRLMPDYKWELLVGADLVKNYDPCIPEGAVT
jgi:hypothetical protein